MGPITAAPHLFLSDKPLAASLVTLLLSLINRQTKLKLTPDGMFHTFTQDIFRKPSGKLETDHWWKEMVMWRTFWLSYSEWTNQIPLLSVEAVGENATLPVGRFFLLSQLYSAPFLSQDAD